MVYAYYHISLLFSTKQGKQSSENLLYSLFPLILYTTPSVSEKKLAWPNPQPSSPIQAPGPVPATWGENF